jgi:hypothetical protein
MAGGGSPTFGRDGRHAAQLDSCVVHQVSALRVANQREHLAGTCCCLSSDMVIHIGNANRLRVAGEAGRILQSSAWIRRPGRACLR